MNTSFLDDIFTISHNGKDVVERKDSNNKILWERAIPKTTSKSASVSLTNTRKTGGDGVTYPVFAPSKVLPSVIAYGKCAQSDSPAPDAPEDIVCNNGTLKAFYGNKYTAVGAQTGMILQKASHAIQSNANYSVSAPIFLKAGEYSVSYRTDTAGSRPFIICEALPNGNPVPVEDGEVWYKGTPSAGLNTDTFTVDHDMNVLISLRITFADVFVGPVNAITYADGTPEVITVQGKNLFSGQIAQFDNQGGTGTTYTYFKLPVENASYYLSLYCKKAFTGSSQKFIGFTGSGGTSNEGVVWATNNATTAQVGDKIIITNLYSAKRVNYVSMYSKSAETLADLMEHFDIQLEYGAEATTYEPYVAPQTASVADLCAVGNYEDTQNVMTGTITRNIGIKVFDGTELYSSMAYGYATDELSSFTDEGFVPLCTHFVGKNTASAATDTVRLYFTSGGVPRTYFFVDQTVDDFSTADKFKAWIAAQYAAGTPVMVVYPLATPQTEQVTSTSGQISLDHKGTYTLSTSGSVSNLQIQATYLGR